MVTTVGLSEKAVEYAVLVISAEKQIFSCGDIAEFIGCNERTVWRAMPKLISAGIVNRSGSRRTGFSYTPGKNCSYRRVDEKS